MLDNDYIGDINKLEKEKLKTEYNVLYEVLENMQETNKHLSDISECLKVITKKIQ